MLKREFLFGMSGLLLASCATGMRESVEVAPPFAALPPDEQAIRIAVFRHMFAYSKKEIPHRSGRFFLSLKHKDAPPDLIAQLRAEGYDVLPESRYKHGRGVGCFQIGEIERPTASRAKLYGGYVYGSLGESWGPFKLTREEGQWRVVAWTQESFA